MKLSLDHQLDQLGLDQWFLMWWLGMEGLGTGLCKDVVLLDCQKHK